VCDVIRPAEDLCPPGALHVDGAKPAHPQPLSRLNEEGKRRYNLLVSALAGMSTRIVEDEHGRTDFAFMYVVS
jgi:hypothetical protein